LPSSSRWTSPRPPQPLLASPLWLLMLALVFFSRATSALFSPVHPDTKESLLSANNVLDNGNLPLLNTNASHTQQQSRGHVCDYGNSGNVFVISLLPSSPNTTPTLSSQNSQNYSNIHPNVISTNKIDNTNSQHDISTSDLHIQSNHTDLSDGVNSKSNSDSNSIFTYDGHVNRSSTTMVISRRSISSTSTTSKSSNNSSSSIRDEQQPQQQPCPAIPIDQFMQIVNFNQPNPDPVRQLPCDELTRYLGGNPFPWTDHQNSTTTNHDHDSICDYLVPNKLTVFFRNVAKNTVELVKTV